MKLIVEPADGVGPLLTLIKSAKKSVEIAIFRFDRKDIETALKAAAERGVEVTALIAFPERRQDDQRQHRFIQAKRYYLRVDRNRRHRSQFAAEGPLDLPGGQVVNESTQMIEPRADRRKIIRAFGDARSSVRSVAMISRAR